MYLGERRFFVAFVDRGRMDDIFYVYLFLSIVLLFLFHKKKMISFVDTLIILMVLMTFFI